MGKARIRPVWFPCVGNAVVEVANMEGEKLLGCLPQKEG